MRPPLLPAGDRRHRITIEIPGVPQPDGSGGYTEAWQPIAAPLWAKIAPAVAADLERLAAGTVIAVATHIVRLPYLPGVSTRARVVFGTRHFSVAGVADLEERQVELILFCVELEPAGETAA